MYGMWRQPSVSPAPQTLLSRSNRSTPENQSFLAIGLFRIKMRSPSNHANLYSSGPLQAKSKRGWSIRTIFCKCPDQLARYKDDGPMQNIFAKDPDYLGKPSFKKSADFLNSVQKAFDPPPLFFEHLSYFAGGVF